jgi:long-chain acyl-CoA synthetase
LNLDRKKDLVKLRGGEYVSLTKVEMAISKLPIIENCCLCASSSAEYTVILICPNPKQMAVRILLLYFVISLFIEELFGETFR